MMIFPMPTYGGGSLSNRSVLAGLIVCNFLFAVCFGVMYYLFLHDSYKGTFWDWSFDMDYFLEDKKSNAGIAWMAFWIPMFIINGIAFIIWLWEVVEKILNKVLKEEDNE